MKAQRSFSILCRTTILICSLIGTLSGCLDDNEAKDWSETIIIEVSSELGEYYPSYDSDKLTKGIKIRTRGDSEWTVIPTTGIEGFAYEKGVKYSLKVEKIHLANPPADGSNVKYKLIEILSKEIQSGSASGSTRRISANKQSQVHPTTRRSQHP